MPFAYTSPDLTQNFEGTIFEKVENKMKNLKLLSDSELRVLYEDYLKKYKELQDKKFNLDMSRGKPSPEQLNLSLSLLDALNSQSDFSSEGCADCRNYGLMDGLPELKQLISELTGIDKESFIIGGNSSLSMMFDVISCFMIKGVSNCTPWIKQEKIKFLCPVPGYDRHFAMCEHFRIELISVEMTPNGPDMDFIEEIVSKDKQVKGIWCVPKYSNPQGITYSPETVERFASLKPLAPDFRIFWDNAYFVHDLTEEKSPLLDIMQECKKHGNEELPIIFFSTSKITLPGAGVAFLACGPENLKQLKENYSFKTVGFDKINQLRHLKFLKNPTQVKAHMKKQAEIIKPKFDVILNALKEEFQENPILSWTNPKGGYFISVNTEDGCAKKVAEVCKNCGLTLTKVGSTFPYGKDPRNKNIRLAPTYLSAKELQSAIKIFCLSVKIAYVEKRLLLI